MIVQQHWGVKLPSGKVAVIGDLPIDVVEPIGVKHKIAWIDLLVSPALHMSAARDLYGAICRLNEEVPRPIDTLAQLLEIMEDVDLDLPATFDEHDLPLATAPGVGSTESSPGEPKSPGVGPLT